MSNFVQGTTLTAAALNAAFAAVTPPTAALLGGNGTSSTAVALGAGLVLNSGTLAAPGSGGSNAQYIAVSVSDEVTPISVASGVMKFRMPFSMTVTAVRSSVSTASASGAVQVDLKSSGATILGTPKLNIDVSQLTSTTSTVPNNGSLVTTSLGDDTEVEIDITVAGAGATGLKVLFIGTHP
jgi:hypothetical protein